MVASNHWKCSSLIDAPVWFRQHWPAPFIFEEIKVYCALFVLLKDHINQSFGNLINHHHANNHWRIPCPNAQPKISSCSPMGAYTVSARALSMLRLLRGYTISSFSLPVPLQQPTDPATQWYQVAFYLHPPTAGLTAGWRKHRPTFLWYPPMCTRTSNTVVRSSPS